MQRKWKGGEGKTDHFFLMCKLINTEINAWIPVLTSG